MTTVNQQEVEKFTRMANEWWSETGKFKPLHKFNPTRITFIERKISEHFNCQFNQLKILDVGCGGGLISEPFAKMGAFLTGIDAGKANIEVAKIHAQKSGLKINYQNITAEELEKTGEKFDVVFALEIIEHVDNVEQFIQSCANLVKKDGLIFIATINRNIKSLLTAKIAAEYILRWLPRGTHDWKKFLKPSEINNLAAKNNLKLKEIAGFEYSILNDSWQENKNTDVNYMMVFSKN
jgi:2-polyprenyl-6-hydroxyphenyl methylase/3-demethylubiquinone-9 3-methyltransferase